MAGGALGLMIAGACVSFSGNVHDACSKAAEAGAKQTGFEQNVDMVEKGITKEADRKAHYLLGDTGMGIAGGGIFIVKAVKDRSVKFNLPTLGLCSKINTEIGAERSGLTFIWMLP